MSEGLMPAHAFVGHEYRGLMRVESGLCHATWAKPRESGRYEGRGERPR